jgi:glutaminase
VEGRVTTALPEVATVCNGSQLELNCTITGSGLQWRIIPEQNHSQLSALPPYSPTRNQSFQYGDSTITFTIISHPMELTSYITVINPVTNTLNETVVECIDLEDQESPSSTVINIVNDQGKSNNYIPCLQGLKHLCHVTD